LISDTHSYLDNAVFKHFKDCDEIWHGMILAIFPLLKACVILNPCAAYTAILTGDIRADYPEQNIFTIEDIGIKAVIMRERPPAIHKRAFAYFKGNVR